MANYQDHLLFGSALVLIFAYFLGPYLSYNADTVIVSAAFILLASVFPDVDHKGSIVHKKLKALTMILVALIPMTVAYPNPLYMLIGGSTAAYGTYYTFNVIKPKHRAVTHTFKFAVLFALVVGAMSLVWFNTFVPAVFSFIAYLSHLVLDGTLSDL